MVERRPGVVERERESECGRTVDYLRERGNLRQCVQIHRGESVHIARTSQDRQRACTNCIAQHSECLHVIHLLTC